MPADGSQYLVTQQDSTTTRGDTSSGTHSQTVTYNNVTDVSKRNLTHPKVITVAEKHDTGQSDQSEAVTKVPRSLHVQFAVDLLGVTISC